MSPLELITIGVLLFDAILIPAAIILWKTCRKKIDNEELRQAVDDAVAAAEELKASDQLKTSKQDYVWSFLEKHYPEVSKRREEIEMLIHAAINAAGLGMSGKE